MTRSTRRTRSSSSKKEEEEMEGCVSPEEEEDPPSKKARPTVESVDSKEEEMEVHAEEEGVVEHPDNGLEHAEEEEKPEDLPHDAEPLLEKEEEMGSPVKEVETEEETAKKEESESPENAKVNGNKEDEAKKKSPELERFWKAVTDDPMDFSSWTCLLQFADANGDLEEGREAYDAFLDRYPYCYGYWKKYADLEKRKGTPERTMMVFERGIASISLSADLWIHYLNHVRTVYDEDFIRTQYERAVGACGLEWRSDKLWDHYVKWEISIKCFEKVLCLYDRILKNPTQGLTHQFEMFRDFVKEHKPKEILSQTEFLSLRKEVLQSLEQEESSKSEESVPKETSA
ncbi:PRPF39 [Lepeophtheirus salmonis]|uniref:PRPF39 n=1 Tax=Lepeophtheirus salmonis TaxID=72036 RepID=A0A7R8H126_LEPSM|nr:PRPF39 [Lepeophtheirus salmonis]CAF2800739.1 PRPF39 [Lepeophtheirus salmonis]